ncbi:hypothetical protein CDO73_03740 [Saccharibacillus sp. O23]|uniref:hypothetical protein n=1 Tax=Saccharibacillus sp. O23 TaxID=2009338 RepID=UPI000B4E1061|nr:hypothetical protein [Saccharibacillus sp. O23]OWR32721.1 hypothetical protein CDO73_03740 [Saccharibacillus sp. O23]
MDETEVLRKKLLAISVLIKAFLKDSSMLYIAGSLDIVENGAYEWLPLNPGQKIEQKDICEQYEKIVSDTTHLKVDSSIRIAFEQSSRRVLSFLRQDSIIWQNTTSKVYDEIVKELDLQLKLSEKL